MYASAQSSLAFSSSSIYNFQYSLASHLYLQDFRFISSLSQQNYPLYILTTSPQPELKFHYIVHTCLDVIEEKGSLHDFALKIIYFYDYDLHCQLFELFFSTKEFDFAVQYAQ